MSNSVKFNQKGDCFTLLTVDGFAVYQTDPLQLRFQRALGKAVVVAEVLQRTNIIAFVYCTDHNKLIFWDDRQAKVLREIEFPTDGPIVEVSFRDEYLYVALTHALIVYEFETFRLIEKMSTGYNPKGLGCLGVGLPNNEWMLAGPAPEAGIIQVLATRQPVKKFRAHRHAIGYIALNRDCTILATASDKGTVIRLWRDTVMLCEFRRGIEATQIHSIVFHPVSNLLCVTGGTQTAHIYFINDPNLELGDQRQIAERGEVSILGKAWRNVTSEIPRYFHSTTSLIQITVPEYATPMFANNNVIIFVTPDGQLSKYTYFLEQRKAVQTLFQQL
jgi:WD repeat-containing protein 45